MLGTRHIQPYPVLYHTGYTDDYPVGIPGIIARVEKAIVFVIYVFRIL